MRETAVSESSWSTDQPALRPAGCSYLNVINQYRNHDTEME